MRTRRAETPALLTFRLYFCVGPAPLNIPTLLKCSFTVRKWVKQADMRDQASPFKPLR